MKPPQKNSTTSQEAVEKIWFTEHSGKFDLRTEDPGLPLPLGTGDLQLQDMILADLMAQLQRICLSCLGKVSQGEGSQAVLDVEVAC